MSRLPMLKASIIVLSLVPVQALAEDWPCYRLEFDYAANERPNWFISFSEVDNTLEWIRGEELIILETSSGGSGIPVRGATEPKRQRAFLSNG